jgi:hypothetical protein
LIQLQGRQVHTLLGLGASASLASPQAMVMDQVRQLGLLTLPSL